MTGEERTQQCETVLKEESLLVFLPLNSFLKAVFQLSL